MNSFKFGSEDDVNAGWSRCWILTCISMWCRLGSRNRTGPEWSFTTGRREGDLELAVGDFVCGSHKVDSVALPTKLKSWQFSGFDFIGASCSRLQLVLPPQATHHMTHSVITSDSGQGVWVGTYKRAWMHRHGKVWMDSIMHVVLNKGGCEQHGRGQVQMWTCAGMNMCKWMCVRAGADEDLTHNAPTTLETPPATSIDMYTMCSWGINFVYCLLLQFLNIYVAFILSWLLPVWRWMAVKERNIWEWYIWSSLGPSIQLYTDWGCSMEFYADATPASLDL